jgi:hypothetical protein
MLETFSEDGDLDCTRSDVPLTSRRPTGYSSVAGTATYHYHGSPKVIAAIAATKFGGNPAAGVVDAEVVESIAVVMS